MVLKEIQFVFSSTASNTDFYEILKLRTKTLSIILKGIEKVKSWSGPS